MIYEVSFQIPRPPDGFTNPGDYAAYLDATVGKNMWVDHLTQTDHHTTGQPTRILCPETVLTKLKWADISDGYQRVLNDRQLQADEANQYRLACGGRFPWE